MQMSGAPFNSWQTKSAVNLLAPHPTSTHLHHNSKNRSASITQTLDFP